MSCFDLFMLVFICPSCIWNSFIRSLAKRVIGLGLKFGRAFNCIFYAGFSIGLKTLKCSGPLNSSICARAWFYLLLDMQIFILTVQEVMFISHTINRNIGKRCKQKYKQQSSEVNNEIWINEPGPLCDNQWLIIFWAYNMLSKVIKLSNPNVPCLDECLGWGCMYLIPCHSWQTDDLLDLSAAFVDRFMQ